MVCAILLLCVKKKKKRAMQVYAGGHPQVYNENKQTLFCRHSLPLALAAEGGQRGNAVALGLLKGTLGLLLL